MSKKTTGTRADEALRALMGPREETIRNYVAAINAVEALDEQRETLVQECRERLEEAKAAGWKEPELKRAGLAVPASLNGKTRAAKNNETSPAQAPETPQLQN